MRTVRQWWTDLSGRGIRPTTRRVGLAAAAVLLLVVTLGRLSALAGPQAPPEPHHVRGGHAIPLGGAIPPALAHATRGAREDGGRALTLTISLQPQNRAALAQLILDQQNPRSSSFHKYLSPQAFTDRFGASPQTVADMRKFLEDAGFRVTGVSANRLQINAAGTVARAERAFSTTISQYALNERTVYAPDSAPLLPDRLAGNIVGITGLDNIAAFRPHAQRVSHLPAGYRRGPGPGGFDPNEVRAAYDIAALIGAGGTGTGQRVAVLELAPFIPGDLSTYHGNYSLPNTPVNQHPVDGAMVSCSLADTFCDVNGIFEADLDIEMIYGIAPNATQDVYTGPNTAVGVLHTYNAIISDDVAKIVTTSWGLCEPYAGDAFLYAEDNLFIQAAAQGQTIYAASGNNGSDDCYTGGSSTPTVDTPASDPYVVGVGGTSLTLAPGPSYGSETAWR